MSDTELPDPLRDGVEAWFIDEGIQGQGPRPDYLKGKYKTVADQARAYNEIEKKLGGLTGAPESYNLDNVKEQIDLENPYLKDFLNIAKESRLNQDSVQKMMGTLADYQNSFIPDQQKELAKLGADGEKRYQVLDQWAKNSLSAKAQETFAVIPKTSEVIEFLDEMRQMQAKGRSQPPGNADHAHSLRPPSVAEVRQKMADNPDKYNSSPEFRAQISRELAQALGGES